MTSHSWPIKRCCSICILTFNWSTPFYSAILPVHIPCLFSGWLSSSATLLLFAVRCWNSIKLLSIYLPLSPQTTNGMLLCARFSFSNGRISWAFPVMSLNHFLYITKGVFYQKFAFYSISGKSDMTFSQYFAASVPNESLTASVRMLRWIWLCQVPENWHSSTGLLRVFCVFFVCIEILYACMYVCIYTCMFCLYISFWI